MGTVGCLLSVRSREPMECDLSVSIICLFFPLSFFFYTLRRNPKYIQGRPERKIPAVWDPLFTLGTKTEKIEEGILFYDPLRAVFDVP